MPAGTFRYRRLAIFLGMVVVLAIVAAGAFQWGVWRTRDSYSLAARLVNSSDRMCLDHLKEHDALADAAADFRRNDTRFYFISHGHTGSGVYDISLNADGVDGDDVAGCKPSDMSDKVMRELPFREQIYDADLEQNVSRVSSDFLRIIGIYEGCNEAVEEYQRTYNRELAHLSPASIKKYCR